MAPHLRTPSPQMVGSALVEDDAASVRVAGLPARGRHVTLSAMGWLFAGHGMLTVRVTACALVR